MATYTVAGLMGKSIGFLLLPLYTRALSPAEYGRLSVIGSVMGMTTILLTFGLEASTFRIYFELAKDAERQRSLIDSIWRFLIYVSMLGCISLGAISLLALGTSTDNVINGPDLFLGLSASGIAIAAQSLPLPLLRAQERLRGYLVLMGINAIGGAATAATLVVVLGFGVPGMLIGGVVANLATLIAAMFLVPWRRGARASRDLVERSLRFGLPMLPHFLSMQALNLADRLILIGLVTTTALGLYGLAANFAIVGLIACQAVTQATMPSYARVGTNPDSKENLAEMIVRQISVVALITTALALLGPPTIGIVAAKSYAGAADLFGWIVLGYGFVGLYGVPMNGATMGAGRTSRAWIATLIGALSNIGLILALTPIWGIEGAAIASAGGYLVLLAGISLWAHSGPNPATYDWRRIIPGIICSIVVYVAATATFPGNDLLGLLGRIPWLALLALLISRVVGVRLKLPDRAVNRA